MATEEAKSHILEAALRAQKKRTSLQVRQHAALENVVNKSAKVWKNYQDTLSDDVKAVLKRLDEDGE